MKKLMVAAVVCALGVGALEVRATDYTSNTTIDSVEDIPADYTFNVSEGVIVEVSVSIADGNEAVKVIKRGLGDLKLQAGNTFSGGLDVQGGNVWAEASGALGLGIVTITQGKTTKGCVCFNTQDAVFDNDFSISGTYDSGTSALSTYKNVTLNGTVVSDGGLRVENYPVDGASPGVNKHSTTYNGTVTVASGKQLYVRTYGTNVFNAAVTAGSAKLGGVASSDGFVYFKSSENAFSSFSTYKPEIICLAANVMAGASWSISPDCSRSAGKHALHMNGFDQTLSHLSQAATVGSAGSCPIDSPTPCTLTLTGPTSGKTWAFSTGHILNGSVSLIVDGMLDDFEQTFTDLKDGVKTEHGTSGSICVKKGTLRLSGKDTSFPNVPEVVVEEAGKLVIDSTGQTLFSSVTNLQVVGKLEIAELAGAPFAAGVTDLTVGEAAEISIGGSYESVFREVFLPDGTKLPKATYEFPCEAFPQLRQGKIQVVGSGIVDSATWTGSGTDDEVTTVANWDVDEPDFSSGLMSATFAVGGSQATVSSAVKFKDVSLSAAEGEAGFTFAKRSDAGKIVLKGSSLELAAADAPRQYVFDVPAEVEGLQTLVVAVPPNNALSFNDGVIANDGSFEFSTGSSSTDAGTVFLGGDSVVAGAVKFARGFSPMVSGHIATPDHVDQGPASEGGERTFSSLQTGSSTDTIGLFLTNAVIEKPVYIAGGNSAVTRTSLWALEGTTNLISGNVLFGGTMGGNGLRVYKDGELTLSGGVSGKVPVRMLAIGDARVLVRNRPIDIVKTYAFADSKVLNFGLTLTGGTLDIDAPSNSVNYLNVSYDNSSTNPKRMVEFRRDDMFSAYPATLTAGLYVRDMQLAPATEKKIDARVEFHSTTQRFARVLAGPRATFNGEGGSRLEVVGEQAAGDYVPESSVVVAAPFTGGLSLLMGGTGSLVLTNAASTSTGSLAVTNGELRVAAGASWTNVSSVAVGGTGRLTIDAVEGEDRAKVFGKGAALELSEDGVIAVPDGVRIRFLSLTMDGAPMAPGVYSYATAPEAVKRHLADTSGEIMIGRPGLLLMVR